MGYPLKRSLKGKMSRKYEYINISTPQIQVKPGLSHDLHLLRDLEIANARTTAELGPLPPGGLLVAPKCRMDANGRPKPEHADHQTMEEDAMKLNQMAATAAMTAAMVACAPSQQTETTRDQLHVDTQDQKRHHIAPDKSPQTPELYKSCGDAKMWLRCNLDDSECRKTSLSLTYAKDRVIDIPPPHELAKYTAVGLDCAFGSDGNAYFIVEYGERPFGCKFCEWFHLYDASGSLLTHSNPPILIDNTLPENQKRLPNNEEFDALTEKFGIGAVNIELLDRPVNNH